MLLRNPYSYYFSSGDSPNITYNGSCSEDLSEPWSERCDFVQHNENCLDVDGFINYVSLLYW